MSRFRAIAVALPLLLAGQASAQEAPHVVPAPAQSAPAGMRTLVLAGGCFWGIQGVFEHVRGVERAVAGYSGGSADAATYDQVSTGTTGNAETVSITYDPKVIDEGALLQIFFSVALDPTEHDRQGPDEGTQYRSVVFAHDPAEAAFVHAYIAQLDAAHVFPAPIATSVEPFRGFERAEGYHQDFLARNPDDDYIAINDMPKVQALRSLFPARFDETPRLAGGSGS